MTAVLTRQYWLFQYKEGVRVERPFENSRPGDVVPWNLKQYKMRIQSGDVVFYWRAGPHGGLKGWGVAEAERKKAPGEEFERIAVRTRANFGEPIPRDDVRALPELSDLAVVKQGRQGTNFPVSAVQAFGLTRLIESRGFEAPPVDVEDVRRTLGRWLERDLQRLTEAATNLPSNAGQPLLERLSLLTTTLRSTRWDPAAISAGVDEVRREIERGAFDREAAPLQNDPPAAEYAEVRQAARQFVSNLPDLESLVHASASDDSARTVPRLETARARGTPSGVARTSLPAHSPRPAASAARSERTAPPKSVGGPAPATSGSPPTAPKDYWPWQIHDRIGIGPAVDNLARYIAHEDLVPPQAIGIFGDWGSGKTFFMSALRSQIALMAWQSREALADTRTTAFCSRIVQIEFNAWHYVESNLWASLAGHIFEKLHEALKSETEHRPELDANVLFEQMVTYREAMQERDRRAQIVKGLEARRRELEEIVESRRSVLAETLAATKAYASAEATATLAKLAADERARVEQLVGSRNVQDLADSVRQLEDVVGEATRFGGLVSIEIRRWGARQYALAAAVSMLVPFAVPFLASGLHALAAEHWTSLAQDAGLTRLAGSVGGLLAMVAGALSWLAGKGKKVLTAARNAHRFILEGRERAEREKAPAVAAAEVAVIAARSELEAAEQRLQAQRDQLAATETALRGDNPGVQLKNFLEQRVRSQTYQQHLGLVSLVRKDFEMLSDLMDRFWAARDAKDPAAVVQEVRNDGTMEQKRVPFIERIVLYIDDLDRCPPEKVVDVLQAVHLLLGLKLFVVVVGVDVRWIGRSLSKQYPELLSTSEYAEDPGTSWRRASSDDYLEKIFQIPFRLVPLDRDSRQQFVMSLMTNRSMGDRTAPVDNGALPALALNPRELSLFPQETGCVDELHECLGRSPRRVKRFVDMYRLMRAGMEPGDVEAIMAREGYRHILALFALLTGSVRLGPKLIEVLHRHLTSTPPASPGLTRLLDAVPELARYDEEEVASARAVLAYLDNQANSTETIEGLLEWMPVVTQYSFREVRLTGT